MSLTEHMAKMKKGSALLAASFLAFGPALHLGPHTHSLHFTVLHFTVMHFTVMHFLCCISLCCISLCCISLCTPNIQRTACRCSDLSIVRGHKKVGVELPRPHTHCLFLRLKDVINGFANLNETHIRLLLYAWFVPFL